MPVRGRPRMVLPSADLREDLEPQFARLFSRPLNPVQAGCFPLAYHTDDNLVVSAPTASGKTGVLELLLCRFHKQARTDRNVKAVYIAPTRAICAERARDWRERLQPLGLNCVYFAGDQQAVDVLGTAQVIVTTTEKWDWLTRSRADHSKLHMLVKLVMIDEVHTMSEKERGPTLECVIRRIQIKAPDARFVAVSATIPNATDMARFLSAHSNHSRLRMPASVKIFGEDTRHTPLQKSVIGLHANTYDFGETSNPVIQNVLADQFAARTAENAVTLIFCPTKATCQKTANFLAQYKAICRRPEKALQVNDRDLGLLLSAGIAFHHGGLAEHDRLVVEQGAKDGHVKIICCTTTLAMGVNLPCHTVIINDTSRYNGSGFEEYSDLDMLQMIGRAGRERSGNAARVVILTKSTQKARWQQMTTGRQLLESALHLRLAEHLLTEIVVKTITSDQSAKEWLKGTFFAVRSLQNPQHYQTDDTAQNSLPRQTMSPRPVELYDPTLELRRLHDARLDQLCEQTLEQLDRAKLITLLSDGSLEHTQEGDAMARHKTNFETMKAILAAPEKQDMGALLEQVCKAEEMKTIKLKDGGWFNTANNANTIRFPIEGAVVQDWQKMVVFIQAAVLDRAEVAPSSFDVNPLCDAAKRVLSCIAECARNRHDAIGYGNALELRRSLEAKAWDNTPAQLLQLHGIGTVFYRKLEAGGLSSIAALEAAHSTEIEGLVGKPPPFGKKLLDQVARIPKLSLSFDIRENRVAPVENQGPLMPSFSLVAKLRCRLTGPLEGRPLGFLRFTVETCRGTLIYDHNERVESVAALNGFRELPVSHNLRPFDGPFIGHLTCDLFVGNSVSATVGIPDGPTMDRLGPCSPWEIDFNDHLHSGPVEEPVANHHVQADVGASISANVAVPPPIPPAPTMPQYGQSSDTWEVTSEEVALAAPLVLHAQSYEGFGQLNGYFWDVQVPHT